MDYVGAHSAPEYSEILSPRPPCIRPCLLGILPLDNIIILAVPIIFPALRGPRTRPSPLCIAVSRDRFRFRLATPRMHPMSAVSRPTAVISPIPPEYFRIFFSNKPASYLAANHLRTPRKLCVSHESCHTFSRPEKGGSMIDRPDHTAILSRTPRDPARSGSGEAVCLRDSQLSRCR